MEVSAQDTVIGEFDKLRDALVEGPANWMPGMYESPTGKITELEADSPFGRLARYARIRVTDAKSGPNEVIVPLNWHSLEAEAVFPVFNGQLRLSRYPDGTNRLELQGDYEPPGGIIGHTADAVAMYAVAEATVQDFVERIAGVLARNALGRSVDEQVRSGRLTLEQEPPGC
jgi:hypothetical protein